MNITDLKASLPYLFQAEVTPFLWGHAGVGKSTAVKQYAESQGFKFFPFYLGTMSDVGDVLGLATFVKDDKGQDVATKFAIPIWMKEMIDYCEANPESGAVIFLDEFNRGRRDILNGMFSLALDKTFHTIKLPKNCHIIAAGNPPTDEYFTTDVNETALMARFVHIKLEPSFNEWVSYAKATDIDPTFIGFLKEQPELIADAKSAFTLPVKVDNRSFSRLDKVKKTNIPADLFDQVAMGIIGAERLVAYKAYLARTDRTVSPFEILAGNKEAFRLIEVWSNPADIKSSHLSTTVDSLYAALVNKDLLLTEDVGENFVKFCELLPKDVAYPFVKKMVDKNVQHFVNTGDKNKVAFSMLPQFMNRFLALIHDAKGTT